MKRIGRNITVRSGGLLRYQIQNNAFLRSQDITVRRGLASRRESLAIISSPTGVPCSRQYYFTSSFHWKPSLCHNRHFSVEIPSYSHQSAGGGSRSSAASFILWRKAIVRSFSGTSSWKSPEKDKSVDEKSEAVDKGAAILAPPDADFVEYLSGKMKHPVEKMSADEERKNSTRRQRGRLIALDPNKELHKQIQVLQNLKKEQSRIKTAKNVHRALWGNVIICTAKLGAWISSGSSSMLAEFIHSVVDCGNQALLLVGLRDSRLTADRSFNYGYGKSIYFWALVSALGTFFLGAGVSMTHAIGDLIEPSLHAVTPEVWGVLTLSLLIDGYVFSKTIQEIMESKPKDSTFWSHLNNLRDPATLAILLEDGAACLGIVMAFGGIALSSATGNPIFDGIAGVGISTLLGLMGVALVRVNHRFLIGQAVDRKTTEGIEKILLSRRSIDGIGSVQSQWTGPETFSYKAEVDFDGTYLAAKLMPVYQHEFLKIKDTMDEELQVLLALYAEDVMRTAEREVRNAEAQIRKQYPGAEFIELEPMSRDVDRLAIDDNLEAELRRVESDALNRYLKSLRSESEKQDT